MDNLIQTLLIGIFSIISLLFWSIGIISVFRFTKAGAVQLKGTLFSTLFLLLGVISLSVIVYLLIPEELPTILLSFCWISFFIVIGALIQISFLSFYHRGRQRGQTKDVDEILKLIYPFKRKGD